MFSTKSPAARASGRLSLETLEGRRLLVANLVAVSPADDMNFVPADTNLVLTFDEGLAIGNGAIEIVAAADDSVLESIDVADASKLTIDGNVVTVDPASDLPVDSGIYVLVPEGAFVGLSSAVYTEDFEGVELIPFEVESDGNDEDTDWSDELPAGWERDNGDTPAEGPPEFFGFNVFDKESWIAAAGNQGRSEFTRGQGNVVVADADEYDDLGEIDDDLFNVFLTTPEISLDGVAAGQASLKFDSSFRPYPTMVGLVDVSFDGGNTWDNLLTLNDDTVEGGTSSLARANVKESLELNNPANATAQIRFGMVDAGNDWWWAIDNVAIDDEAGSDPLTGISDPTAWNFRTAPGFTPAIQGSSVAVDANLVMTYSRDVVATPGLGQIEIYQAADGSLVESIALASERVSVSGATVTIDPVNDLTPDTEYYVLLDEFTVWDTEPVSVAGISLVAEDFEDLTLIDSVLVGNQDVDDYVIVMSGILDVQEAGEYTFGTNSDDGQQLYIDVGQDGLDTAGFDDEIIFDNTTHGTQDRLSTCNFDNLPSCVEVGGDDPIELAVGEYAFEFRYFDRAGGSSGEFFYAPGKFEAFDATAFALVGDDSQGIGIVGDGIEVTTHKSAVADPDNDTISDLDAAAALIAGDIPQAEGFPVTEILLTADVYNTGGTGRFNDNHPLPGFPPPPDSEDWSPEGPAGWTCEATLPDGAVPEFSGWGFLDKDFWITQQGNQERTTFTKGQGTLAVSDPDAVDDFVNIDDDLYTDVFLTTPELSLEGVAPGSVSLEFDSSFRPYPSMVGLVDVSFDGGNSWDNLLTLDDDTVEGGTSSLARADATEVLPIDNPDSGTVKFRWGMVSAGNDWWWAIDNIRVTAEFPGNPQPGIDSPETWRFTTGGGGVEPIPGDITGDGNVDFADFLILSSNFGMDVEAGTGGDFDSNGKVEFPDFLVLSANFGTSAQAAPTAVPVGGTDLVFAGLAADEEESDPLLDVLNLDELL